MQPELSQRCSKHGRTFYIDTKFQGRYSPGETDFAPLIAQLHANDAKVVYVAGISNGLGKLLVAARSQNYRPLFVASEQAWSQDLWTIAGESADGVLFTFFPDPARNAQTAPVVARMRQQRREPSVPGLYTYAAVQVLTQAAAIAGSIDVPKITGALHEGRFNTVIEPLRRCKGRHQGLELRILPLAERHEHAGERSAAAAPAPAPAMTSSQGQSTSPEEPSHDRTALKPADLSIDNRSAAHSSASQPNRAGGQASRNGEVTAEDAGTNDYWRFRGGVVLSRKIDLVAFAAFFLSIGTIVIQL